MFDKQITAIAEYLRVNIPLTSVEYFDKRSDYYGTTDTKQNYGHIRSLTNEDAINFDFEQDYEEFGGCNAYKVTGNYRLIIDHCSKKMNKSKALQYIISVLNDSSRVLTIKQAGIESEAIYLEENKEIAPLIETNLFLIDFELSAQMSCNQNKITCLESCCI